MTKNRSKSIVRQWIILGLLYGVAFGTVEREEQIEKTFRFDDPMKDNLLIVDNIWGDIMVTGTDDAEVRVKIRKCFSAESDEALAEMAEKVRLDIFEENDRVELYVEGPFRDHDNGFERRVTWKKSYHEALYDFEIEVPMETFLELSTVNNGEIVIKNMNGNYKVNNVNGVINMERIGGSGEVYTVNGDVTIDFVMNPSQQSRFGSLNGEVLLYFISALSADFYLKTFNGAVYSDFPVSYLPVKAEMSVEEEKGRYIYRMARQTAIRIGDGGVKVELDGFNGDMFILKK